MRKGRHSLVAFRGTLKYRLLYVHQSSIQNLLVNNSISNQVVRGWMLVANPSDFGSNY